ncbi:DUF3791 domain-containing protein [Adlercreutzia sp. ZJ473]|uniref:DUF3791 domain-containing protein n=1 Tax=Adlercreutzia sp. ZJ473 TaxID=2722822 RepID=UPI001552CA7F
MPREMEFFIFLLEKYAEEKGVTATNAFDQWDAHGITQEIYDNYEMYHSERIENAFEDIDSLLATGRHAW